MISLRLAAVYLFIPCGATPYHPSSWHWGDASRCQCCSISCSTSMLLHKKYITMSSVGSHGSWENHPSLAVALYRASEQPCFLRFSQSALAAALSNMPSLLKRGFLLAEVPSARKGRGPLSSTSHRACIITSKGVHCPNTP